MDERVFANGDLILNVLGEVRLRDAVVKLTPTEYSLLVCLAAHAGKPLTSRTLLVTVWGGASAEAHGCLRVHIQRLRRKLADDPHTPRIIATERGIGYRFIAEEVKDEAGEGA